MLEQLEKHARGAKSNILREGIGALLGGEAKTTYIHGNSVAVSTSRMREKKKRKFRHERKKSEFPVFVRNFRMGGINNMDSSVNEQV
eukprot:scaffold16953_cov73-Skeletonema_marinoi.AAC.1